MLKTIKLDTDKIPPAMKPFFIMFLLMSLDERYGNISTVDELNECIFEMRKLITENGLDKVMEIKMTLSENLVKELKEKCFSQSLFSNEYLGIPFKIGEKTRVEIGDKRK